jgi:hypothetical protein
MLWIPGRGWLHCPSSYLGPNNSRVFGVAWPYYRLPFGLTVLHRERAPSRESAADRLAKAEAAELTPAALEQLGILPESPVCVGHNPRARDQRSLRQIRCDHARAEIVSAACRRLWSGDVDLWTKAVEWYENRPSGGETRGEALFACLATFCSEAKAIGWRGVAAPERAAFESAAGKLARHVVQ